MDKSGNIKAVVLGVGGFLGVGEHLVAVPLDKVKFVTEPVAYSGTASNSGCAERLGLDHHGLLDELHHGKVQSLVSGSCRVQRHQGRTEGDA